MITNKNRKYPSNDDIISLIRQCALLDEFIQSEDDFLSLLEEGNEDSGRLSEQELLWAAGGISRPGYDQNEEKF